MSRKHTTDPHKPAPPKLKPGYHANSPGDSNGCYVVDNHWSVCTNEDTGRVAVCGTLVTDAEVRAARQHLPCGCKETFRDATEVVFEHPKLMADRESITRVGTKLAVGLMANGPALFGPTPIVATPKTDVILDRMEATLNERAKPKQTKTAAMKVIDKHYIQTGPWRMSDQVAAHDAALWASVAARHLCHLPPHVHEAIITLATVD